MQYLFEILVTLIFGINLFLLFKTIIATKETNFEEKIGDIRDHMNIFQQKIELLNSDIRNVDSAITEFKSPMKTINRYLTSTGSLSGTVGEWGLEAIINDVLVPNLYETNFRPNPETDHTVEYAVKMPGNEEKFLCIDSKLPITALEAFLSAHENASDHALKSAKQQLSADLTVMAADIKEKYIVTNQTPDFAIMFVIEKVNSAIDHLDNFRQKIWNSKKVLILGPNNLISYLATLKMAHEAVHVNSSAMKIFKKVSDLKSEFSLFNKSIEENELRSRQFHENAKTLLKRSSKVNKKLDSLLDLSNRK